MKHDHVLDFGTKSPARCHRACVDTVEGGRCRPWGQAPTLSASSTHQQIGKGTIMSFVANLRRMGGVAVVTVAFSTASQAAIVTLEGDRSEERREGKE